ncbi:circadian locomoter output cycles protein kaput-like [Varroa jacobsoni]|uniref:circadian locomoter output cycles protein kaput-like n=1 Tax=Varroa jacobsoni TaxID=62625 RepID=UPI000BF7CF09|nr:circadian locomoter output cycles protein kaput-like [Varroa jacobsoni]
MQRPGRARRHETVSLRVNDIHIFHLSQTINRIEKYKKLFDAELKLARIHFGVERVINYKVVFINCVQYRRRKNRNLSEKKRRDIFNKLISELNSMVTKSSRKMDKSAVLQASIAYLRHFKGSFCVPYKPSRLKRHCISEKPQNIAEEQALDRSWFPDFISENDFCRVILESQDAFTLCVSYKGVIMYVSNAVASVLGYVPHYLRSAIFSIVHKDDHADIYSLLRAASGLDVAPLRDSNVAFTIILHMRWGPLRTHPSVQTAVYEPFKLVGYFRNYTEGPTISVQGKDRWHPCFVAVALPLRLGQVTRELMVPDDTTLEFISHHNMEWKFVFLDTRAANIIGYLPFELIGTSGYNYYHVDDLSRIVQGHRSLLQTGEGSSCHYRFLTKGQQWLWLQTRYYISYQQWTSRPRHIVCTHRVLSYSERDAALKSARCSAGSGSSGAATGTGGAGASSSSSAGQSTASINCGNVRERTPTYSTNGSNGFELVDQGSDKAMGTWGGYSFSGSSVSTLLSTPRSYESSYSCSSRSSISPNPSEQSCNGALFILDK